MMKYVIFGAGTWGRRLINSIKMYDGHEVVAFIDSNPEKQGKLFENLPVISIEEYKENYSDCIIIIATIFKDSVEAIKDILHKNNISIYFNMRDCPWDFFRQFEGRKFPFDEAVNKIYYLIHNKAIGISEINLFGILLYDYLRTKQQDVTFLVNKDFNMNDPLAKKLLESYSIITHVGGGVILQINPNIGTDINMKEYNKDKVQFWEFPYLPYYQNPGLTQFKDIYTENDRCFIVCTGPSLRLEDLEVLHENNEITFSMNRVYKVFSQVNWRPTYYFAADIEMFSLYSNDILNMNVSHKFLSDWSFSFWQLNKNVKNLYRYHVIEDYERINDKDFSDNITKGIYAGGTVAYQALQSAIYMGLKKIYIIGADCEYHGDDGGNDRSHFIKGYNDNKRSTKPYHLDTKQMFKSYQAAKNYADRHGIEIYNATRGGKLEIFERVNFDSLFKRR